MLTAKSIVYIAGPMSGVADHNRPAFEAAEVALREKFGCQVLNPIEHDQQPGLSYCTYMEMAMEKLKRADAVLLLPGFQHSLGAMFEMEAALRDEKAIYFFTTQHEIIKTEFKGLNNLRYRRLAS